MANGGGPIASRTLGRYDMPLPPQVAAKTVEVLESKKVMDFIRSICPRGEMRTTNILLSVPGSERQPIHVDSSWEGKASKDPAPHYITILIPLTEPKVECGGTRLWPRSHKSALFEATHENKASYVDAVSPFVESGDALIFDGLLAHCGLENQSSSDRFFFYG